MNLIDKDALIAEIDKRIIDAPINYIGHQRVWAYNDVKEILNTLEMTEEERKLLVTDLCARLPYGVKVCDDIGRTCELTIGNDDLIRMYYKMAMDWAYCKPYLRPMSSMTEEECIELGNIEATIEDVSKVIPNVPYYIEVVSSKQIDWLNAHHFDYRGLIEKGLAIAVTKENNPYKIAEG